MPVSVAVPGAPDMAVTVPSSGHRNAASCHLRQHAQQYSMASRWLNLCQIPTMPDLTGL